MRKKLIHLYAHEKMKDWVVYANNLLDLDIISLFNGPQSIDHVFLCACRTFQPGENLEQQDCKQHQPVTLFMSVTIMKHVFRDFASQICGRHDCRSRATQ